MYSRKSKTIPDDALKALTSTAHSIISHSNLIYIHLKALFDLTAYPSVFEIELGNCRNGSEEKEVSETDIVQAEWVLNNPEQYNLLSPIAAATYHEWVGNAYLENGLSTHDNEKILKSFEHCNAALRIHFQTLLNFQYNASHLKEIAPAALHLKPLTKIIHHLGKIYYHLDYNDWPELCFSLELNIRTAFIFGTRVKDPHLANAFLSMGVVYSKTNQHQQALQYFHRAIAATEEHMDPLSWIWAKSCMQLGMTYHKLGSKNFGLAKVQNAYFSSATIYFKKAIEFYSNSPHKENQKRYRNLLFALASVERDHKKVCDLLGQHTPQLNKRWPAISQPYTLSTQSFLSGGRTCPSPAEQPVRAPSDVLVIKTALRK